MARLSLIALQAILATSTVYGSPVVDSTVLPTPPKLPVDPRLAHAITVIPKATTIDTDELLSQANRLSTSLKVEPFVGSLPGVSSENATNVQKRNVIGQDNRYQYTDRNYPFRTIGKLAWTDGTYCSASVIGARTILTGKHCIPPSNVGATFYPAIDNDDKPFGGYVIREYYTNNHVRDGSNCDNQYDWGILVVSERIGDRLGYMGIKTPSTGDVGKPLLYGLGYPSDKDNGRRPYKQDGITVLTRYESNPSYQCDSEPYVPLITDQDLASGQSGSPTWEKIGDDRYIWGTVSSGTGDYSIDAAGRALVQAVTDARQRYN